MQNISRRLAPKPLVSVIVTAYNIKRYIYACLKGLERQTLDKHLFELIVVDDGSTDGTRQAIEKFAPRFPHFQLIALPENTPGGTAIPSNTGMRAARGEYIGFVDGDDIPEPELFEVLLHTARNNPSGQADLALCTYYRRYDQTNTLKASEDQPYWRKVFLPEFSSLPLDTQKETYLRLSPAPWRKLYRADFLREHGISFPEGDFFYEDNPFHWFNILRAERIACVDRPLLLYRKQRLGQSVESLPNWLKFPAHVRTIRQFMLDNGYYERFGPVFDGWAQFQLEGISSFLLPDMLPAFRADMLDAMGRKPQAEELVASA